jgi:hypothetical protein
VHLTNSQPSKRVKMLLPRNATAERRQTKPGSHSAPQAYETLSCDEGERSSNEQPAFPVLWRKRHK